MFCNIYLSSPQVCHHDDDIVNKLSPELGFMHPALFFTLLDFPEHQRKVEMVETQDAHEAIQEYSCEKINFIRSLKKYHLTNKVSERPYLLFLDAAEYDINHQHYCQHSVKVSHCQCCAEHPAVGCEHHGANNEDSGASVTNHFDQEHCEMFCLQSLRFACVPERINV